MNDDDAWGHAAPYAEVWNMDIVLVGTYEGKTGPYEF
jgi:hypothetical protein